MSIRKKLLLVMTGLLVLATGLAFVLQFREADRLRAETARVVDEAVDRLVAERASQFAPPELFPSAELDFPGRPECLWERWEKDLAFTPAGVFLRIERHFAWIEDPEEPLLPGRYRVLPSETVLPPETVEALQLKFRDPIEEVRKESLPRQIVLAGLVLLVGFVLIWLLAGHLTRPLKDLTGKMAEVAGGNLSVKVEPRTRDEVRQMSLAFNLMVDRLREKQELEHKMFRAERLTALGTLAAGVAHDIRNPLNTIGLTLAHLRDAHRPEEPEQREAFSRLLDDVKGELDRLNELVKNFLSLAHPDRGEKVYYDLRELVEESLRLFRKEAESNGVAVRAELEEVEALEINPQQIRRAVTNVLLNALQAIPPGGGNLQVSLFQQTPEGANGVATPHAEVVLRIADDGRGMDGDQLDKAFLPYYTTSPEGTGLGLPIARWAVEANDGRMEVSSRPEIGTEVDFIFPLKGTRS